MRENGAHVARGERPADGRGELHGEERVGVGHCLVEAAGHEPLDLRGAVLAADHAQERAHRRRPVRLRCLQERPHPARCIFRGDQSDHRRFEQGDRAGFDAVVAGELEGDEPAVGMPDEVGPLDAQTGEQLGAQHAVVLDAPRAARGYRPAVAQHGAVHRLGKRGVPADERQRVREHHRLTVAEQLVLDLDAIELHALHAGIQALGGDGRQDGGSRSDHVGWGAESSWAAAIPRPDLTVVAYVCDGSIRRPGQARRRSRTSRRRTAPGATAPGRATSAAASDHEHHSFGHHQVS
jgi:hypothetical protein